MHKKTERNNYALASSVFSDIPLSLDKRDSQALYKCEATQFQQNSSIYHAFNASRSRAEQSLNLHFSTARPFYGEEGQDYYETRETGEKPNYNKQQREHFIMQKIKPKKSPNKKLMIYSYSNIVLFRDKINKILLEQKKRIFMMLYRVKREDKTYLFNGGIKNTSFYSGQTNNTSRQEALYRIGFGNRREERYAFHQEIIQGINIIEGWLEYRILLDKRKSLNLIFQCGNDRKKFSLELSQSLKVDNTHNQNYYLTDYNNSNEISLTNALPQQIQESLVYTLENNSESTRKQLTQSTLQKFPTLKNYPTSSQLKSKGSQREVSSQTSKKSSPMYKLKSFNSSHASQRSGIKVAQSLNILASIIKNENLKIDGLTEGPFACQFATNQEQNKVNDHEEAIKPDTIRQNLSQNDFHQQVDFQAYFKKIATPQTKPNQNSRIIDNSAKYSDVSNYKMENTVHKHEQPYQIIVNYHSTHHPTIPDQTVLKKYVPSPSDEKHYNSKFQKYYVSGKQLHHPAIATPRFSSEIQSEDYALPTRPNQEKLVCQLDNERIRIFGNPNLLPPPHQTVRTPIPARLTTLRGNFSPKAPSFSPHNAFPTLPLSSDRRVLSPKMQSDRNIQPISNRLPVQAPSLRIIDQPIRQQNRSPDVQMQHQIMQAGPRHGVRQIQRHPQIPMNEANQRNQRQQHFNQIHKQLSPSPSKPIIIQNQNPIILRKQLPNSNQIIKGVVTSPQKLVTQKQILSKQMFPNNYQREDYGITSKIPNQRQYTVFTKINPIENHIKSVQKQYQLPIQTEVRPFQNPVINQLPIIRQNQMMKDLVLSEKNVQEQKRPQSSASSPKLFFNYKSNNQSHIDEQITVNSNHLTKNNSSISRPKSMNSKLFVTLRKEQ